MDTIEIKITREDLYVILRALDNYSRRAEHLSNDENETAVDRAVWGVESDDARRVRTTVAVFAAGGPAAGVRTTLPVYGI